MDPLFKNPGSAPVNTPLTLRITDEVNKTQQNVLFKKSFFLHNVLIKTVPRMMMGMPPKNRTGDFMQFDLYFQHLFSR